MGLQLLDQFSLLHVAVGILAYFWDLSFHTFFIIHLTFELLENTKTGMNFINGYFTFWPGGKPQADSALNMIGDTVASILGWWLAYWLDYYGTINGWYLPHLAIE